MIFVKNVIGISTKIMNIMINVIPIPLLNGAVTVRVLIKDIVV